MEFTGLKRHIEHKISDLMRWFPAVVLLGARQVGKTSLAKQMRPDWRYLDLERARDLNALSHDMELFFEQNPNRIIFDEAQEYPELFTILRSIVDESRESKGRFLLTGSSQPALLREVSETLAGRVAMVELGTLKASEYYQKPLSHFYDIFKVKLQASQLEFQSPPLSNQQMHHLWLYGGYPEPLLSTEKGFFQQWMENYFATYINRDIAKLFPGLNRQTYQRFLSMLANLSSTIINKANLARALEVSQATVKNYLDIAEGTFLWRQLPSYEKSASKSAVKMSKGYLRDTGLLHALLRIHDMDALQGHPIVGHSFEAFVIEELLKGLQATLVTGWQAYYFRTRNGSEVDLILEGPFGVLPVEIKYGMTVTAKQLQSLTMFVKNNQCPFGIVINQSKEAQWLTREIYQLPVGFI